MGKDVRRAKPLTKDQEDNIRYWASKTPQERIAEAWRLSVEAYGIPEGSFKDGPVRVYRLTPDGKEELIREWSGPNPLRPAKSKNNNPERQD